MKDTSEGSPRSDGSRAASDARTLDTLRQRLLASPPKSRESSTAADDGRLEALLAPAGVIKDAAAPEVTQRPAEAEPLLGPRRGQPPRCTVDAEREFSVCIDNKIYAPRMHSFHQALNAHYLATAKKFATQNAAYSEALSALAMQLLPPSRP